MLLREIKRHYYRQSQTIQAVHKQVTKVVDISNNSPTFKMIDWQTSLGGTMAFDNRKITDLRTVSIGEDKCSTYWRTNQSLEIFCICYEKESQKMKDINIYKSHK